MWVMLVKKAHEGFLDGFGSFRKKKKFFLLKSFALNSFSKCNLNFQWLLICWALIAESITKISYIYTTVSLLKFSFS